MAFDSLRKTFTEMRASIVKVRAHKKDGSLSVGTGFLVHVDGYIITAWHVVKDSQQIEVLPENWRHPIPATRKLQNQDDMAILSIDYKALDANYKAHFSPAKICPRHQHVLAGDEVGIAGYAWGMDSNFDSTLFVFKRVVALNIMHPEHSRGLFYYLDGTAIAGMSGGPVFEDNQEVVGIIVRIQPEAHFKIQHPRGNVMLPSPEHLTIALQSFYIHTGLEELGIYL